MTVTGQPRFDFYADLPDVRLPYGDDGPIILFFSYLPDFYHPGMVGSEGKAVWQDLLDRTEQELWGLAAEGYRVLVKPHPLQPFRTEAQRIAGQVGDLYGSKVFTIDPARRRPPPDRRQRRGGRLPEHGDAGGHGGGAAHRVHVLGPRVRAHRGHHVALPRDGRPDGGRPRRRPLRRHHPHRQAGRARARRSGRRAARPGEVHLGALDGGASRRTVQVLADQVAAFRSEPAHSGGADPGRRHRSMALRRYRARERAIGTASRMRGALRAYHRRVP